MTEQQSRQSLLKTTGDSNPVVLNSMSGDGLCMTTILHIYTRVSSVLQQEEGTSLENQKQIGIRKAAELGFEFRLWNEGGQSSFHDDLNNRPVLVSLLALIESGGIEHLFVYNADRLSRNQQTWAVIRYKLLTFGVTLHTSSGQMQLKNPVDDLMLGILSEISQYDNRIRAERSRLGRFQKVQQGSWKGGPPPFGYRLSNRTLEIDPFESKWVQKIYDWYCHGVPVKEIQSRLSTDGIMTRRGNSHWSLGSIQLILRNPVYCGHFDYTDKMIGETVRIKTPAIINSHLFQITQDRRQKNRGPSRSRSSKHFYLLRGLLECGHCGYVMGGRTHKAGHQHVYYCVKKERSWKLLDPDRPKWKRGNGCTMIRSINIVKTDQIVWAAIKSVLPTIRERSLESSNRPTPHELTVGDRDGLLPAVFTGMSTEQIDGLSEDEKKALIGRHVSRIIVVFDKNTGKHRLNVEWSEWVSDLIGTSLNQTLAPEQWHWISRQHSIQTPEPWGDPCPKKSVGSGKIPATESVQSVTVE